MPALSSAGAAVLICGHNPLENQAVVMTDTLIRADERKSKGPIVWLDMDQTELDNAYDQAVYAPNQPLVHARRAAATARAKARLGAPQRF